MIKKIVLFIFMFSMFSQIVIAQEAQVAEIGVNYYLTYCFKNGITNPSTHSDFLLIKNDDATITVQKWNLAIPKPTKEQLMALSNDVDSTIIILNELKEKKIQDAKSLILKQTENSFLTICDQLNGTTNHVKLGFAELEAKINVLSETDPMTAMKISIKLLTIDSSGKREGGLLWWDNIAWHNDI